METRRIVEASSLLLVGSSQSPPARSYNIRRCVATSSISSSSYNNSCSCSCLFLSLKNTTTSSSLKSSSSILHQSAASVSASASGSATEVTDIDLLAPVKKKAIEVFPALKGTSIFLIGVKSAVKTSLGELLADALRYYYFDSDSLVEEAAGGESSGKSFRERDKEGFHESETEVLKQLSSMGRLVVCAGDGAVQNSTNLALLRHGLSIWIDVPLNMVAREILGHETQVLASELSSSESHSEVLDQLTVLYEEMRGGYATADATVSLYGVASQLGSDDLNSVTKEQLALEVLKEIEKLTRVKKMMEEAARPF